MSTFAELVAAPGFSATVRRTRAGRKPDPYNPSRELEDWGSAGAIELPGFISTAPVPESADGAREQVDSSAVLTCPDPTADILRGDVVERVPADGRRWRVAGIPSADGSPFTGWAPTLTATLEEVIG